MLSTTGTETSVGRRGIGPIGTAARAVVGLLLAGSVAAGHWSSGFHLDSWLLGLAGFPAALLRRDDQVGCLVFSPLDQLERRWPGRGGRAGPRGEEIR